MTTSNQEIPRETRIVEMVFPNQTNHYGTLFGGDALLLMDYGRVRDGVAARAASGRYSEF